MSLAVCRVTVVRPLGRIALFRPLITISTVAAISCFLAHLENAQGQLPVATAWVRTADGWEPSGVLRVERRPTEVSPVHPLLVAGFELGASLFALIAFPSRQPASKQVLPRVKRVRVSRRGVRPGKS